jgi:hypothetical protein
MRGRQWGSKMRAFVRFGVAGLSFLAFAAALGTLTPVLDVPSAVDDSPANPWITVEVANGQVSYYLPSGIAPGVVDDFDATLAVPSELKADWKASRSSGSDAAMLGYPEAPNVVDESSDLNADWELSNADGIFADYTSGSCSQFGSVCFGGTNGSLYAGSSTTGSVQKAIPDMVGSHRGWNRRPYLWGDSKQGESCTPSKELCPNAAPTPHTPEPSGIALLGMGLIALAIGSRRRLFA